MEVINKEFELVTWWTSWFTYSCEACFYKTNVVHRPTWPHHIAKIRRKFCEIPFFQRKGHNNLKWCRLYHWWKLLRDIYTWNSSQGQRLLSIIAVAQSLKLITAWSLIPDFPHAQYRLQYTECNGVQFAAVARKRLHTPGLMERITAESVQPVQLEPSQNFYYRMLYAL